MCVLRAVVPAIACAAVWASATAIAGENPIETASLGGSYASTFIDDLTDFIRRGALAAKDAARPHGTPNRDAPARTALPSQGPAIVAPKVGAVVVSSAGASRFEGSGSPGSQVVLMSGNRIVGTTTVGPAGRWQLVLDQGLGLGDIRLAVSAKAGDGARQVAGDALRIHLPATFAQPVRITQSLDRAAPIPPPANSNDAAAAEARRRAENLATDASDKFGEILAKQPPRQQNAPHTVAAWNGIYGWVHRASEDYQHIIVAQLTSPGPAGSVTQGAKPLSRTAGSSQKPADGTPDSDLFGRKVYDDTAQALDHVQDWLARATRDYQRDVARKLTEPLPGTSPPVATAGRADEIAKMRSDIRTKFGAAREDGADAAVRTELAQQEAERRTAPATPPLPAPPPPTVRQPPAPQPKDPRIEAAEKEAAAAARKAVEDLRAAEDKRRADEAAKAAAEAARKQGEAARKAEDKRRAELEQIEQARKAAIAAAAAKQKEDARRLAEQIAAKQVADQKAEERRTAELRAAEKLAAEKRAADQRAAELKAANEQRANAQRTAAEQRTLKQEQRTADASPRPVSRARSEPPAVRSSPVRKVASRSASKKVRKADRRRFEKGRRYATRKATRVAGWSRRCGVQARRSSRFYVVRPGDTLWGIAGRYYGVGKRYPTIYIANRKRIADPDVIRPCQRLQIPA